MNHIVYNAIRTPDGTVLESHHTHDYRIHVDKTNGKEYMIDGGKSYIRSSANGDEMYLTVYDDAPHKEIREVFTWGTYGKNGDEPLQWKKLKDMTTAHILAVLETQTQLPDYTKRLFEEEINFRELESIKETVNENAKSYFLGEDNGDN
jgi:hypothetical protein